MLTASPDYHSFFYNLLSVRQYPFCFTVVAISGRHRALKRILKCLVIGRIRCPKDKICGARNGQEAVTACQTEIGSKELTVNAVGESACNDSFLRFSYPLHLRSPVLAGPTLVIQGLMDGTWKYV